MIVIAQPLVCADVIHGRFVKMLPAIRQQASVAFRGERPESKEELTAEVVANAYAAFVRLVERGKGHLAYPTPLAPYAVRQVRAGRRVGTRVNVRDVLSPANRRSAVERLDRFDQETGEWQEVLVEDRHGARGYRCRPHRFGGLAAGAGPAEAAGRAEAGSGRDDGRSGPQVWPDRWPRLAVAAGTGSVVAAIPG